MSPMEPICGGMRHSRGRRSPWPRKNDDLPRRCWKDEGAGGAVGMVLPGGAEGGRNQGGADWSTGRGKATGGDA